MPLSIKQMNFFPKPNLSQMFQSQCDGLQNEKTVHQCKECQQKNIPSDIGHLSEWSTVLDVNQAIIKMFKIQISKKQVEVNLKFPLSNYFSPSPFLH